MTRRSVSLPPALERNVRLLQAKLLTTLDRDISFTQALNAALAIAFAVPGLERHVATARWRELVAEANAEDGASLADAASVVFGTVARMEPSSGAQPPLLAGPPPLPLEPVAESYAGSETRMASPPVEVQIASVEPPRAPIVVEAEAPDERASVPHATPIASSNAPDPEPDDTPSASIESPALTEPASPAPASTPTTPPMADPSTWAARTERLRAIRSQIQDLATPSAEPGPGTDGRDEQNFEAVGSARVVEQRRDGQAEALSQQTVKPSTGASEALSSTPAGETPARPEPIVEHERYADRERRPAPPTPSMPTLTREPERSVGAPPSAVEHERFAERDKRPAPGAEQPRVMTSADLDKLRRAILGGDASAADEPVSKQPPPPARRPAPPADAPPSFARPVPKPDGDPWDQPRRDPTPAQRSVNPDYPGIDPSKWEKVEESKKEQPKALTYEELSRALEDAGAAWNSRDKKKDA